MSKGQQDACSAFNEKLLADPAAMKEKVTAVARRWALAAEKASGNDAMIPPPSRDAASGAQQDVRPRPSRRPPSTFTCGDIRMVSASPSSSFATHTFRDVRDTDSDEALPAQHRAHSAVVPGTSSDSCLVFPDSLPLPDLEPLRIDEFALRPGAEESDFDDDDDDDYDNDAVRDPRRD